MKIISVEHLSKSYRLGQISTGTFSYDLELWWARMRGQLGEKDRSKRGNEELWALRDVSFTVEQGEVLGIIGRNGAGKSTLLKILSRVTAPTSGKIKARGRIASLLEVGTGFHPDLTGRENIYLNGAILGMSRKEIEQKFDEIVDFAEVEQFIDTPVKRYSSGMYVRLAFAVAAHLEPEILVVDEVLAVGDAEFQKKCLGKMGQVAQQGRTVLFVSHNMAVIQNLCPRGIWLDHGSIGHLGSTAECIRHYLFNRDSVEEALREPSAAEPIILGEPRIIAPEPNVTVIPLEEAFQIEIPFSAQAVNNPDFFVTMIDQTGRPIIHQKMSAKELGNSFLDGTGTLSIAFPALHLAPGVYSIYFKAHLNAIASDQGIISSPRLLLELNSNNEAELANRIIGKFGATLAPFGDWSLKTGVK